MEELVIQMNGRITKNVDLSVKNVKTSCMSKNMIGILLDVAVTMEII